MLKFEKIEFNEIKNGPLSKNVSIIFSDSELLKYEKKDVESEIKDFFPIVAELNHEKTIVKYKNGSVEITITIIFKIIPNKSDLEEILIQTKNNFIEYYEKVVIPNLQK